VSSWSSYGKEWTKGYGGDASCAMLLFSRTTHFSFIWKQNALASSPDTAHPLTFSAALSKF
jgi:hypothetical protein